MYFLCFLFIWLFIWYIKHEFCNCYCLTWETFRWRCLCRRRLSSIGLRIFISETSEFFFSLFFFFLSLNVYINKLVMNDFLFILAIFYNLFIHSQTGKQTDGETMPIWGIMTTCLPLQATMSFPFHTIYYFLFKLNLKKKNSKLLEKKINKWCKV